MKTSDILKHLLPEEILTYFDLVDIREQDGKLVFCLDEKQQLPEYFPPGDYEAKSFTEGKSLHDFPLRGKAVILYVRRRKWLDKSTGKVLTSAWDLSTQGTKYTKEFGAFLKELAG
jgi:hypothetical protein